MGKQTFTTEVSIENPVAAGTVNIVFVY